MKRLLSIRLFFLICALGFVFTSAQAQDVPLKQQAEPSYPETLPSFYIGARGGYLFSDKKAAENPAYYLNEGYFTELNFGWRSLNNWLGWQLAVGHLTINRKLPFPGNAGFGLSGYDVLKSTPQTKMWSEITQDDRQFLFDDQYVQAVEKTDLSSWYAMTGPEFWFGKKRLQGFVSLNAGVGMTKFGHYYIQGEGVSNNTLSYKYYSAQNKKVVGPVDVSARSQFVQYGMSQEAYENAGSPTDFTSATIEDESQINFMGKGTIGLEYFITPRLSLNASASYWYIMAPNWSSHGNYRGSYRFTGPVPKEFNGNDPLFRDSPDGSGRMIKGQREFTYERDYEPKALGQFSANIGLRYWLGREKTEEPIVEEKEEKNPLEESAVEVASKDLLITVKDQPTGLALSGVRVNVTKNGEPFYTGMTDTNGALPEIDSLTPGNYRIKGTLNGIETTIASIDSTAFEGDARVITRELLHKDLRFTLIGHTVDKNSAAPVAFAKTTLHNKTNANDNFQTSDKEGEFRFQLDQHTDYSVYAEKDGYFSNRKAVSTKGLDRSKTLYVDLKLGMSKLKKGTIIELENIYYDFDKANIRPDAAVILDDLYQIMINNPTLVIELSSHTDSRGSDAYNMALSQRRAESAVRYLINKGIDADRLVAKGYGETRLVNECANGVPCSEAQHQANRRTEIKILHE